MPITIKELLAADTISQAVDKINFNFDQLLLNGGGPVGPIGPVGPPGPIGGRGLRGTQWYEDPAGSPGTDPNTLIFVDVLEGDNYLQSDGTVWEYNGVSWVTTPVNLIGPQGIPGTGNGFEFFNGGGGAIVGRRGAYPLIMTAGTGENPSNEGVSSVLIGGVPSNAVAGTVPFTSAYQLTLGMSTSIQSDTVSLFIHQKNASSQSIIFHGGDASGEDFEQNNIGQLSNISLQADDQLVVTVPKAATSPGSLSDLVGYRVNTLRKSQEYSSGKFIQFITGQDGIPSGLGTEHSDFIIDIDAGSGINPSKFEVGLRPLSYNSLMQLGGGITVPSIASYTPTKTGTFYVETGNSYLYSSGTNTIGAMTGIFIRSKTSSINMNADTSSININASLINNTSTGNIINTSTGNTSYTGLNHFFWAGVAAFPIPSSGIISGYANNQITWSSNGLINILAGTTATVKGNTLTQIQTQTGNVNISTLSSGNINLDSVGDITNDAVVRIQNNAQVIDNNATGAFGIITNDANSIINTAANITSTATGTHSVIAQGAQQTSAGLWNSPLNFDGYLSSNSPGQMIGTIKKPAVASGFYNLSSATQGTLKLTWQKIGNIVHCNGYWEGSASGIPKFNFPFRPTAGSGATEIDNIYGHGVIFYASILYTCEIFRTSDFGTWGINVMTGTVGLKASNEFYDNNTDQFPIADIIVQNDSSGTPKAIPQEGFARFTFSYRLLV